MKNAILYSIFLACFVATIASRYPNGAAATLRQDLTKSPLSSETCANCHGGGNYAPTMSVQLLQNGTPVTAYKPDDNYTLHVTINPTKGTPGKYGFQVVALQGTADKGAGTFSNPPTGFRITTVSNRQYPEQSSPRSSNTFDIAWKAPSAGSGSVRFYASGIAANGTGGTGGDSPINLPAPVTIEEQTTTATSAAKLLPATMLLYPNPVADVLHLNIQVEKAGNYWLYLYDANGKQLQQEALPLLNASNTVTIPMNELPGGVYLVRLSDGKRVKTQQIVKQ